MVFIDPLGKTIINEEMGEWSDGCWYSNGGIPGYTGYGYSGAYRYELGDVRHKGLMCGVEIVKDKSTGESFDSAKLIGSKLCKSMWDKGAMMRPLGDVIVIMPPIAIDIELLGQLLDIVHDAIENDLPGIIKT